MIIEGLKREEPEIKKIEHYTFHFLVPSKDRRQREDNSYTKMAWSMRV
jgi:hypothetical protein